MEASRQQFEGYYLLSEEDNAQVTMVLENSWRPAFRDVIQSQHIHGLRLSHSVGWRDDDISFVKGLDALKKLEVYNWDVKDVSPIEALPQLEEIGLQCLSRKAPDFSRFKNLKRCFLNWRPAFGTITSASSLESLNIVSYPYRDVTPLKELSRLSHLALTSKKLESLEGIEQLTELVSIDLYQCPNLERIDHLQGCPQLETIEIDSCKKVYDLSPLATLGHLKKFVINNCGNIKSLAPFKSLPCLSELYFTESTKIEDGDLGFLAEIPSLINVSFANRKHYSVKRDEIQEIIARRQERH